MIHDLRTFTVSSGRFSEFMDLHKTVAVPILKEHLGTPVGYWTTVTGEMNQFVHLWKFEDLKDMEERHAALGSDPGWRDYVVNVLGRSAILQRQESILLRPINFTDAYALNGSGS